MLREKRNIAAVKNDILNKSPQINVERKSNIIVVLQNANEQKIIIVM